MKQTVSIFLQFLRRDTIVFVKRLRNYLVNFVIIYPALYALVFGFLIPNVSWGAEFPERSTILFIGSFGLYLQILLFSFTLEMLFDLEGDRFIDYQSTILHARIVFLERLVFATLFCTLISLPYYLTAKIVLGSTFVTGNMSFFKTLVMIFLSTVTLASINLFGVSFIASAQKLDNFWMRFYHPMFMLGGFMIPLSIMAQFSPTLAKVVLINPMMYITEGLRQSIVGGPQFLPFWTCALALVISTVTFTSVAMYYFKKKVDHI